MIRTDRNMPEGTILKGVGGFYDVLEKGKKDSVYTCRVRGVYRKEGEMTPLPGDRVLFEILNEGKRAGHIEEILERRNSFVRPAVANIDQLAIVMAASDPEPDLMLVDKLTVTCLARDIEPLLIISKTDLDGESVLRLADSYRGTGFPEVCVNKFDPASYEPFHKQIVGKTTAFAGQSGVGKSTILNLVMNHWVMETGEISERIHRGRNTTRHAQLFSLDEGGFILDTPGFSSFSVSEVSYRELENYYPEFREGIGLCRFKGCSHTGEPDCAVRKLLDEGKLDGGRYKRYIELYRELKINYDNRYRR